MKIVKMTKLVPSIRIADISLGIARVNQISIDVSNDGCTPDEMAYIYKQVANGNILFLYYSVVQSGRIDMDVSIDMAVNNFDSIVSYLNLTEYEKQDSIAFMNIFKKVCKNYGCEFIDHIGNIPMLLINKLNADSDEVQILFEMVNAIKGRYDYIHYTSKIVYIAEIIKRMNQLNSDGSVRKLNLKEIDMIFDKVKSNIEI